MSEPKQNPKCSRCRTYHVPELKSSGLPYKSCLNCRNREKLRRQTNKCPHNKKRSNCRDCGGSSIYEHNKRKNEYVDCGGSSI